MLYKPLFIVHKHLVKSYSVIQKQHTSITKVSMAHTSQAFINMLGFKDK